MTHVRNGHAPALTTGNTSEADVQKLLDLVRAGAPLPRTLMEQIRELGDEATTLNNNHKATENAQDNCAQGLSECLKQLSTPLADLTPTALRRRAETMREVSENITGLFDEYVLRLQEQARALERWHASHLE